MPRPDPAEQSRSRRERILDAAFHTFATRGYRETAVDDIAGAAETSKGGIYFHFPTKEAIFRELMSTTADKLVAKVEQAPPESPPLIVDAGAGSGPLAASGPEVRGQQVKLVFGCWVTAFALVGAQMSWLLRPFLGSPDRPFSFFRARESNFFEAVWSHLTRLLGG